MTCGSEPTSAIEMSFSRRVLVDSFQSIAHCGVRILAMRVGIILAMRVGIILCGSGFHTGNGRRSTLGRVACGFNQSQVFLLSPTRNTPPRLLD